MTENCSRLREHIFQLLEMDETNPRPAIKKQTNLVIFWFDPVTLIALILDRNLFPIMSSYVCLWFLFANSICNEAVCLSGCIWTCLTFAPKAFEHTTGFHLPKLIAVSVSHHGWIAFATFLWHAMKYLSPFSVFRGTEMVFSILVTSHYSHTYFMHLWKRRGGSLSMLLFILLNHLWWRTHWHIKLHIFCVKKLSVETQQLTQN